MTTCTFTTKKVKTLPDEAIVSSVKAESTGALKVNYDLAARTALEILSKKQECSALTSNLEDTALSCVMAKRTNERDSAHKIFDILLLCFGSGVLGHQAMVKFEKRRQRDDESIDKFLDDLELLRKRSSPDERISERNLAIASKFMDGVKSDELKAMLATHFTLSLDQVPTPMIGV